MINGFVWAYQDYWADGTDSGWCTREICDTVDSAKQAADDYLKRVRHGVVGNWRDSSVGGVTEMRIVENGGAGKLTQVVVRFPLRKLVCT